jgi:hypothetical protein
MDDSPERESKRRRLLEPSSVSDSSAPLQPDTAFLEALEGLEGPSTHSDDQGDPSLYDPGNEDGHASCPDDVPFFEPCAALHETMDCREDWGTQVDGTGNSIPCDMMDGGYSTVCFGTVSLRYVLASPRWS